MPPYTQLKLLPRTTAAALADDDGIYASVAGVDSFLPKSEVAGLSGIPGVQTQIDALDTRVDALEAGGGGIATILVEGVGDGVADDTAAVQAAIDAIDVSTGGAIEFTANKKYKITSVNIPKNFTNRAQLKIIGNGARLIASGANTVIKRVPTDQTEALGTMIDLSVFISNLTFQGDGTTAGQNGIDLGATYGSVIENCHFYNLDRAIDLKFCLLANVRNCRVSNCRTSGFRAMVGDWTDATSAVAASNHTVFNQCRVYCANGMESGFYVGGSTGCVVDNCIVEGGNPTDNVKYDAQGSTNTVIFTVRNLHSENSPAGAVVRLIPNGGRMVVDTIYHQAINTILVDDTGTVGGSVIDIHVPYISVGSKFRAGGSYWNMHYMGSLGQANMSDAGYWDGALPLFWTHKRFNSTGGAYPEIQGTLQKINAPLHLGGKLYDSNGLQLLDVRQTGLADLTGVAGLVAWDTESATLVQVARRVKTLDDVLKAHGLIGT